MMKKAVADVTDGYALLVRLRTKKHNMKNDKMHKRLKEERDKQELDKYKHKVDTLRVKFAGDNGSHL